MKTDMHQGVTTPTPPGAGNIPVVHYYGEQGSRFTPDLLHCEVLSIRSREHKFSIKPHRHHGLTQLFFVHSGSGEANIDGETMEVTAPAVLVIGELCVHDFLWSHTVEGYVLSLSHSLLEQLGSQQTALQHTRLINDAAVCRELGEYVHALHREYQRPLDNQRALSLGSLINLLALTLERHHQSQQVSHSSGGDKSPDQRSSQYLQRFNQLLNRDFALHRTVASYAREVGVTAPHLNAVCKQQLGKNALALVHERLLLECCRRLSYTVQPISSIADQLGFADPAYFTRFFKRHTGLSPKQYRQQSEV